MNKRNLLLGVAIMTLVAFSGCTAAQSLGETTAMVTLKDGTVIQWVNNKDINFDASFDGKNEQFTFKGNSMTPAAAMANVAASNAAAAAALQKIMEIIGPLIPAAAKAGALAGS